MDSQIVDGYGVSNPNPPKDEREQINAKASEFAMDKPNVKVDENQIRRASNVEKMIPGKN